jgi:predicted phosphoribosyltransferase
LASGREWSKELIYCSPDYQLHWSSGDDLSRAVCQQEKLCPENSTRMTFLEWERMLNPVLFKDRLEGGQKLALALKKLHLKNPVVLAVPSGGVPVALEIAKSLACPFDLVVVRKIQYPWTTEAGFGAVASDGTLFLGPGAKGLSQEAIEQVKHREKQLLEGRKRVDIEGKTAILVDDGLASGSTMFAATKSVRKRKPAQIVVVAPTASGGAVELLKREADRVITLYKHARGLPFAVASSYQEWHDLTDKEVIDYLRSVKG